MGTPFIIIIISSCFNNNNNININEVFIIFPKIETPTQWEHRLLLILKLRLFYKLLF